MTKVTLSAAVIQEIEHGMANARKSRVKEPQPQQRATSSAMLGSITNKVL